MKTLLFNPFEKYNEHKLLSISIIITCISSYLAPIFNARFDGAIDLHFYPTPNAFQGFIDNGIAIFSLVIVLCIVGKIINQKTRVIDILTTIFVSRIPYYFLLFFNSNNFILNASKDLLAMKDRKSIAQINTFSLSITLVFSLFSIAILVWYMALLFNGFKVATNGKNKKLVFLFILGILIAEIASKIILSIL